MPPFNISSDLRPFSFALALSSAALFSAGSIQANPADVAAAFERADLGDLAALRATAKKPLAAADRALTEARLALARLDQNDAASALDRYAGLKDADQNRLRLYYSMQGDLALLRSDYAAAANAGDKWEQLPGSKEKPEYASTHQATAMMRLLRNAKPEHVGEVALREIPYERDKAGLMRSSISIDGHQQEVVVDTGASFSVLNASTAKRLNLRMLGEISVGSSVQQNVRSQVATAAHVEVGGTQFDDVVFLVLEDDQLAYPSIDYRIDAILGFPELHRLGKLHVTANKIVVESAAAYSEDRSNLVIAGTQSFVKVELNGICIPLHVDTGADSSALTYLFRKEHPETIQALSSENRRIGGAGGITESKVLNWKSVHVKIGDRVAPPVDVDVDSTEQVLDPQRFGTIGRDVLSTGYAIDFKAMQITLDGGTLESTRACTKM